MLNDPPCYQIQPTPTFQRNLCALAKKYPTIRSDLQPIIAQLAAGERLGEPVPNVGHTVFKARIKNSDIELGVGGRYRLIYSFKSPSRIVLITLYSKQFQGDISIAEIQWIIGGLAQQDNLDDED